MSVYLSVCVHVRECVCMCCTTVYFYVSVNKSPPPSPGAGESGKSTVVKQMKWVGFIEHVTDGWGSLVMWLMGGALCSVLRCGGSTFVCVCDM